MYRCTPSRTTSGTLYTGLYKTQLEAHGRHKINQAWTMKAHYFHIDTDALTCVTIVYNHRTVPAILCYRETYVSSLIPSSELSEAPRELDLSNAIRIDNALVSTLKISPGFVRSYENHKGRKA